ncbi:Putative Acetamidase [Podospora comata]|uniref:Acetamidase n=1 Tax=Podospora comata TaxID=48703 RepID=A0ABY6S758_PODCO|nr:Putative Acetamidase [Podospora comata]
MPNDGIVVPHPPVARALEIVKQASTNADFEGPIARSDGCPDVWEAIQQSGEPIFPEIVNVFPGGKRRPPVPLPEEQVVLKMKDYRWKYNDYWQSSAAKTSSGRPVDVVIAPAGPHSAISPGKFIHLAYTSALNVLNFCIAVIPITVADKNLDTLDPNFQPLTDRDRRNMASCKYNNHQTNGQYADSQTDDPELFDGTQAAIQMFGRRLGEERVLSVAQIVVDAVEAWKRKHHRE